MNLYELTAGKYPMGGAMSTSRKTRIALAHLYVFLFIFASPLVSQTSTGANRGEIVIRGVVVDAANKPVHGAKVHLEGQSIRFSAEEPTDDNGAFSLTVQQAGSYSVAADESGRRSASVAVTLRNNQAATPIKLILTQNVPPPSALSSRNPSSQDMQFADQPNFTVAGVTDFTAAGGHGSDSSLRTSEALARETSRLQPNDSPPASHPSYADRKSEEEELRSALAKDPTSFETNHELGKLYLDAGRFSEAAPLLQNAYKVKRDDRENEYELALACRGIGDSAHARKYVEDLLSRDQTSKLYRLEGDIDESLGDALAAVHEYQSAVKLEPSEQNYFSWGSELLVHRAVWQAQQVFEEGTKRYPASSRMLTGLGTALFGGAAYSEAATRLCQASDLNPVDQKPYLFLGKVQMAAPDSLACIEPRLRRFVQDQPESAAANYLYAMAVQKKSGEVRTGNFTEKSEAYLEKAVSIDPKYADAYLQLGILQAARKEYDKAIIFYKQAIAADPGLTDAYYRLAVAYDRTGQPTKAKGEFQLHDEVARQQAADIELEREKVKQFLVVLAPETSHPSTQ